MVFCGRYGRFTSVNSATVKSVFVLSVFRQFCFQLVVAAVSYLDFVVIVVLVLQPKFVSGNGRVD